LESGCFEDKALDGFGEVFGGFTCFAGIVFFLITDCWEMLFREGFFSEDGFFLETLGWGFLFSARDLDLFFEEEDEAWRDEVRCPLEREVLGFLAGMPA